MPRFKQGDHVVTTQYVSMSEIRTYPKGTLAVIDTDLRDLDEKGYVKIGAWVRLTLPDTTGLYYPQSQIKHVPK